MEVTSVDTDLGAPPESWEVADLDASVRRLMLTSSKDSVTHSSLSSNNISNQPEFGDSSTSTFDTADISRSSSGCVSEDLINSVDQFLREALQNPRERVSVLRIEQDVEKFMRDTSRQQMELKLLPTSYLRLAAHRIAQHYSLSSMVLLDNDQPDGTGSRIIMQKTSNSKMPLIRLADIPVNLPSEDSSVVKVAIKQRPQKGSEASRNLNSQLSKSSGSKSVEERKDEYNRARARIFNSSSSSRVSVGKPDSERKAAQECFQHISRASSMEDKSTTGGAVDPIVGRGGLVHATTGGSSSSSSRAARARAEKELVGGPKVGGNKVAIFRDRETERKDPDYNRSYDRYMQRFDPGFGFNGGTYGIQPLYVPVVDYNTEFPQLGSAQRSPIPNEHHLRPIPHHQSGHWSAPSTPRIVYGPPDTMMSTFSPDGHVGNRPNSAMYLASQYPSQHAGVPYMLQQEHLHQYFTQSSHQQQHDATFGFARPR